MASPKSKSSQASGQGRLAKLGRKTSYLSPGKRPIYLDPSGNPCLLNATQTKLIPLKLKVAKNKGYWNVEIFSTEKDCVHLKDVHRMVCETFHGPPPTLDGKVGVVRIKKPGSFHPLNLEWSKPGRPKGAKGHDISKRTLRKRLRMMNSRLIRIEKKLDTLLEGGNVWSRKTKLRSLRSPAIER